MLAWQSVLKPPSRKSNAFVMRSAVVYDIMFAVKKFLTLLCLAVCSPAFCAEDMLAEADADGAGWYVGAAGGVLLPGNGNSLRRAAEVGLRGGRCFSDYFALEVEGLCAPCVVSDVGGNTAISGVALQGLFHCAGWETFDRLFGCERFDPFVTFGGAARFAGRHVFADGSHRTALGPLFGIGAFYHLTDSWSLRADARAQVCCDSPCGMLYGVFAGLQYSFGGGE